MSGKVFNHDVSKTKRQARGGAVVTTTRGRAAHAQQASIVDLLAMPEGADIDFGASAANGRASSSGAEKTLK